MDSKKLLRSLTVGRGTILVPHIESYQRRATFPKTWEITIPNYKEGDPHFHPSSDCFASPDNLWLAKKGRLLGSPITPALRRTFDCGHMWHGYIEAILVEMGLVTPENVEKKLVYEIVTENGKCIGAGTADLVDVAIPGHGNWLVDIKTMNKTEFEQGANQYTLQKWTAQVNCYMDWLGTSKAMILAICKDSPHQFREYQIQKNQSLLDEIYDRWVYTQYCLDNDIEPYTDYEPEPELLARGDSALDEVIAKEADSATT
jgi:hypothetical protein